MSFQRGNKDLHVAVSSNRINEVQNLLKLPDTDCNALNHRGETPLFVSLKNKCDDELVLMLIDYGCDVNFRNKKGITPLHLAVQRRSPVILSKLIEKGANVNARENRHKCTPLHIAIAQGRYFSIEELFKWNVSTEMKNCFGQPPLVYGLCKESGDRIIATLINHGCDINVSDNKGLTCLHYASYKKSTFIAQKLIENGADIDCVSNNGNTALHMGVKEGNLEYICMLLYYGASVNEVNSFERTPLHEAIALDYKIIAQHLLNYIIDFNAKDEDDNTYLHMALDQHNGVIIDLLKECDINVLSKGEHSLYRAVKTRSSYETLQILWMKTDFNIFLSSLHYIAFLDEFCECYSFLPNEQFLSFLYAMFDSPCIDDFLQQRDRLLEDIPFIRHLFTRRQLLFQFLESGERLELILVLLSFGINIYFEDICYLYEVYGFDETIELLLMVGSYIHIGAESCFYYNLIVSRICYDNLNIYINNKKESNNAHEKLNGIFGANDLNTYCKFYKATFDNEGATTLIRHGISAIGEISSLLEISRDTVRKVIYANYRTTYSFFVYDAISKLPVPTAIKDILFLRRPIYD